MRSFSLSSSVSSSLSSSWRGSSSSSKKTFKKKTNRCRETSRNFTVASLKNDENDDDDQTTTTTTPVGMVMVKEEAKEKTIESSKVDFAMPTRLLSSENLTTVRRFLPKSESSRILNFFCQKGCLSFFSQNSPKHLLKQQQTG